MKRCEITLPIYYNEGTKIEEEKFYVTKKELTEKFGGISFNPNWSGQWRHKGNDYYDSNTLFVIDMPDEGIDFITGYKMVLKDRFKQFEIHIVVYDITVI